MICFLTLLALLSAPDLASAYYDPGVQRWINRDPIGEWGGVNLFGFGNNQPASGIDAYGLEWWVMLPYPPAFPLHPHNPERDRAQQECLDRVSKMDAACKKSKSGPLTRDEKKKIYNDCMEEKGFPVGGGIMG
jgi:uncharacterized protein RhaS with RHS repeats